MKKKGGWKIKMKKQNDAWIKIFLLPFIIGFSLVVSNVSMVIFTIIGWALLIFGTITGTFYASSWYRNNKEKIKKFLRKMKLLKEK